jgi:DNA ligase D-like protein (predicted 3'-phosphoesterase)
MPRLDRYRAKRDFAKTPEPSGRGRGRRRREPRFVIQQHAARAMHFDFRLEAAGVLKSWAVPKGLSTDPRVKRLAVEVEDHPLAYADFEGRIGAGYGAGRVIVWDTGSFRSLTEAPVEDAIEAGHLSIWLEGEKLRGGWTLQRTSRGAKPQWLVIKRRDEGADARRNPVSTQRASVLSGRTIDEL